MRPGSIAFKMNASSWTAPFRSPADLQRLFVQWGPKGAVALLTLAIAAEAALLITRQAPGVPAPSEDDGAQAATPSPARRNNVSEIIAAHLFGKSAAGADGNAPKTSLQLVLAGVLATSDPQKGQAIIGPAANTAKLYGIGQALPGGARLNAVYTDRVLIENNGGIEALYLPRTAAPTAMAPKALVPTGGQRLQSALQSNSSLLNGAIRMQAVFNQGKLSGYRVFPGRGGQTVFTQLGLRPGDLVTAISGTQLDDASRANEILQTLASADSASVTISRNGQSEDLTLNLSEVANAAEASATTGAETPDDVSAVDSGLIPPPPSGGRASGRPGAPHSGGAQSGPNPIN